MGYCTGNLCVHKGGASMSHIKCGNLLRGALMRSSRSQRIQKFTMRHVSMAIPPTAALSSLSSSVSTPSSSHLCLHLTARHFVQDRNASGPPFLHKPRPNKCIEIASMKNSPIANDLILQKQTFDEGAMSSWFPVQRHYRHCLMSTKKVMALMHSLRVQPTTHTTNWRSFSSRDPPEQGGASDSRMLAENKQQLNNELASMPALHGTSNSMSEALGTSGGLALTSNGLAKTKKFVVVVESPAKAKTIEKYLGADFTVLPTYGHVRDLAARAGSVRSDDDYAMVWEVPEAAQTHVTKIKNALKGAKCLVLATDPDREGEAIAWHVSELMKAEGLLGNRKVKVVRVAFNEITKNSVLQAMQVPRDIYLTLVTAYLARRALDYLIGFALSPLLWRKLPGSRSAGRVQSAALKLVCERENEVEDFVPQEYWTVEAFACCEQSTEESSLFPVRPTYFDGKKIEQFSLSSAAAKLLSEKLNSSTLKVSAVKKGSRRRNPPQPYITSTLQQDAQAKLGFGAVQTMTLAQKLYEGVKLGNEELTGLITYMRTDGLQLSKEAVQNIRALAAQRYGDEYVPAEFKKFNSKVKNAQEAHEAIRPTDVQRLPSGLRHILEKDALSLYTLIWRRTMACQMEHAVYNEVSVDFVMEDEAVCLRATSSYVSFHGFLAVMEDKQATIDAEELVIDHVGHEDIAIERCGKLPSLEKGDVILVKKAEAQQHFTRPPARYSEGLLVKAMEEIGIGRPSTYAATLRTLQSRKYVKIEHHRIIPEVRGRMVTTFLSNYFPKFTDYNFTALLEEQLDEVSGGRLDWKEVLRGFWPDFHGDVSSVMKVPIQKVVEMLQETFATQCFKGLGVNGRSCPSCGLGKLTLKLSRYGSGYFFGCDSYPVCSFKAEFLGNEDADSSLEEDSNVIFKKIEQNDVLIGLDPGTNLEVRIKKGPFGLYIQLGQEGKGRQCFRIPEGVDPADVTIERAVQLMKYPLTLGKHPEDGERVILGLGKKSFFVRHRNAIALVPKDEIIEEMTLERSVELLKGKNVTRTGRKSRAVLAAEEKERKLAQQKKTAQLLRQHQIAVVAAESKAKKSMGLIEANVEEAESAAKKLPGRMKAKVVAAEGKAKKCKGPKKANAVAGEAEADNSTDGKAGEAEAENATGQEKAVVVEVEGKGKQDGDGKKAEDISAEANRTKSRGRKKKEILEAEIKGKQKAKNTFLVSAQENNKPETGSIEDRKLKRAGKKIAEL